MKAIVFLNGEHYLGEIDCTNSYVVACDGGYDFCLKNGIVPDKIIGDFDSLGYVPEGCEVFPVRKDFTDGEAAVDLLKKTNIAFEQVVFYNFGGGREDHFMGNLSVLINATKCGFNVLAKTNNSDIYCVDDEITLKNVNKKTLSVVPITQKAHILESRGLSYNAGGKVFYKDRTLGLSNVATQDEVYIKLKSGKILIFVVRSEI